MARVLSAYLLSFQFSIRYGQARLEIYQATWLAQVVQGGLPFSLGPFLCLKPPLSMALSTQTSFPFIFK